MRKEATLDHILDMDNFLISNVGADGNPTAEAEASGKNAIDELMSINVNNYPGINDGLSFNWWNYGNQIEIYWETLMRTGKDY